LIFMPTPIPTRKIRLAVIGCGRIAANHFGAIAKHADDLELVAVCDTNPSVLKQHADQPRRPRLQPTCRSC
jgi:UDP-N-acetyl-2-amino-2-deoxyglucuronate dehydrogenase